MDPPLEVRVHERREPILDKLVPHAVEPGEDKCEEPLLRERRERRPVLSVVQRDELVDRRRRFRVARVDATPFDQESRRREGPELAHMLRKLKGKSGDCDVPTTSVKSSPA